MILLLFINFLIMINMKFIRIWLLSSNKRDRENEKNVSLQFLFFKKVFNFVFLIKYFIFFSFVIYIVSMSCLVLEY